MTRTWTPPASAAFSSKERTAGMRWPRARSPRAPSLCCIPQKPPEQTAWSSTRPRHCTTGTAGGQQAAELIQLASGIDGGLARQYALHVSPLAGRGGRLGCVTRNPHRGGELSFDNLEHSRKFWLLLFKQPAHVGSILPSLIVH